MQSVYAISSLHKDRSNLIPETIWMENKLVFNDEPLGELSPKMEAWFNIKIKISEEEIRQKRFSGVIEKETLKETLSAMQLSFPFNYEITGNELTISKKK
jgi:transmembrane sensor